MLVATRSRTSGGQKLTECGMRDRSRARFRFRSWRCSEGSGPLCAILTTRVHRHRDAVAATAILEPDAGASSILVGMAAANGMSNRNIGASGSPGGARSAPHPHPPTIDRILGLERRLASPRAPTSLLGEATTATALAHFAPPLANPSKPAPMRAGFHASRDHNCSEFPICQNMTESHCRNKIVGNGFVE